MDSFSYVAGRVTQHGAYFIHTKGKVKSEWKVRLQPASSVKGSHPSPTAWELVQVKCTAGTKKMVQNLSIQWVPLYSLLWGFWAPSAPTKSQCG